MFLKRLERSRSKLQDTLKKHRKGPRITGDTTEGNRREIREFGGLGFDGMETENGKQVQEKEGATIRGLISQKNATRINTLDKFKVNSFKNPREQILTSNMLQNPKSAFHKF